MSRSIKKGPYVESALLKRVVEMNKVNKKAVVKTWSRASTIFPDDFRSFRSDRDVTATPRRSPAGRAQRPGMVVT